MRKCYRTINSIEYAFVVLLMAALSVVGVGGLFFGFQMGQWAEWEGILVGVFATIAGVRIHRSTCRIKPKTDKSKAAWALSRADQTPGVEKLILSAAVEKHAAVQCENVGSRISDCRI